MGAQTRTLRAGGTRPPSTGLHRTGATLFPHFIGEVFIRFLEVSYTFLAEVHSGDTLYPALTITGLEPKDGNGIVVTAATVHNQHRQLVLSGQRSTSYGVTRP